jgi:hypothetical protein
VARQVESRDRQERAVAAVELPIDTEMRLRLTSTINSRTGRVGDRFTATVIGPREYEGGSVAGHIYNLTQSRTGGRTELSLAFDTIAFRDGRPSPFSARVERVIESETVKTVDEAGRIESGRQTGDSEVRGVMGAVVRAVTGVGTVYVDGNRHIVLDAGTEFIIRVAGSPRAAQ